MKAPPAGQARPATIGLLLIALSWGLNWPAVKLAVNEMPIWSMRAVGLTFSAALMLGLAALSGRSLRVAPNERVSLAIAGLLNIAGFNLLTAYAQTQMPTSRATILAYTMPLWAALFAVLFLHERLEPRRMLALALGAAGIGVIVAPLTAMLNEPGVKTGTIAILVAALSWAAGTVYTKRAVFTADPLAATGWQLAISAVAASLGFLLVEAPRTGLVPSWPATAWGWGGLLYNSAIGIALSYWLWFGIVARLPASTAAIGTLLVPVVGVTSAMLVIGDRPSLPDTIGFVLIMAAVFLNMPRPQAT